VYKSYIHKFTQSCFLVFLLWIIPFKFHFSLILWWDPIAPPSWVFGRTFSLVSRYQCTIDIWIFMPQSQRRVKQFSAPGAIAPFAPTLTRLCQCPIPKMMVSEHSLSAYINNCYRTYEDETYEEFCNKF